MVPICAIVREKKKEWEITRAAHTQYLLHKITPEGKDFLLKTLKKKLPTEEEELIALTRYINSQLNSPRQMKLVVIGDGENKVKSSPHPDSKTTINVVLKIEKIEEEV